MKIRKMNWFFKLFGITAISLAPFMIQIRDGHFTERTINHEKTHWYQQLEMYAVAILLCLITQSILLYFKIFAWWLIIFIAIPFAFYYIWYLIEWIIRIFINKKQAYVSIAFEREAYSNDHIINYWNTRKHFAWRKYLCLK